MKVVRNDDTVEVLLHVLGNVQKVAGLGAHDVKFGSLKKAEVVAEVYDAVQAGLDLCRCLENVQRNPEATTLSLDTTLFCHCPKFLAPPVSEIQR